MAARRIMAKDGILLRALVAGLLLWARRRNRKRPSANDRWAGEATA